MTVSSRNELAGMRQVGRAVAQTLDSMRRSVRVGASTEEIDAAARESLSRAGARSAAKLTYDFPGSACISVNDEIVHGVPGDRRLCPGDVVKIDMVAEKDGYVADAARTVVVPPVSRLKRRLVACSRAAFHRALRVARYGFRICDIGKAIEDEVRRYGFTVVEDLSGHGVGRTVHEPPVVPNVFDPAMNEPLHEGMILAIEPIVSLSSRESFLTSDGWTIKTADGSLASHYENTVLITRGKPVLLTAA